MKSNTVRLGDIADICSGGTPSKKRDEYWKGSIPWVSAKSMDADWLNTNLLFISEEGLKAGSKLAPSNSILLLTRGSGLFNRIPVIWIAEPLAFNQDIKCITAKSPLDTRFIYHWLCSQREHLSKMLDVTGLGAGKINTDQLLSLEVFWPEYSVRRKIVTVADSIVEKMKLNQLLNDYLAEMLDARYGRLIAESNESALLVDIVRILSGGTPKTKNSEYWEDGRIPFFAPGDVTNSVYTLVTEKHITELGLDNCNSALYPVDTVFLTARGTVGKVAMAGRPMAMNQSCFAFAGINAPQTVVFQVIKGAVRSLKAKANGATFAAINTRDLKDEEVPVLSTENMAIYDEWAKPLHAMIRSNEEESLRLAELRDALLPKLMSGEIDVSKVDLTPLNNHLA